MLLVDDVIFNLMPLRQMIENKFERTCDEAENGEQAVAMYDQSMTKTCCNTRYRAIFTDIQMPKMDGITAAQTIQAHEQRFLDLNPSLPRVKIVMVSSYDTLDVVKKCRDIGITDYLTKPVSLKLLRPICDKLFPEKSRIEEEH